MLKFVDFRTDTSSSCYFGSQSSHLEAVTLADSNFRYIIPIGLLSIRLKSLSVWLVLLVGFVDQYPYKGPESFKCL